MGYLWPSRAERDTGIPFSICEWEKCGGKGLQAIPACQPRGWSCFGLCSRDWGGLLDAFHGNCCELSRYQCVGRLRAVWAAFPKFLSLERAEGSVQLQGAEWRQKSPS
uniref:Uncharacterized protein n=1 Tax=Junco hyemalis TaxID=40217 RepID=A0A8C5IGN4_JUNHY